MTLILTASTSFSVLPVYASPTNIKDDAIIQSANVKVEDGIHVNVSFKSDQKNPEFIPSFSIQLLSEKGDRVLDTATANSSNFNKSTGYYNVIFNVKDYKSNEKFKLALANADGVVKGVNFQGFGTRADGSYTYTDYKITTEDLALVSILEKKYSTNDKELDDPEATVNTVLYGNKDYPLVMNLETDSSKTLIILQDEKGNPFSNIPLKVQGNYTNTEIEATSDSNGMVVVDRAKVFPIFTVIPNKNGYKVVGSEAGIYQGKFPVLAIGQELQNVTSFKVQLKNEGLESINNPGVIVNITTDGNIDLSANWTEVELALTNKENLKHTATVSLNNNKLALADGAYKIEVSKSDYADVTLKTDLITVKDGKAEIKMTLKPKYTLEVVKENSNYNFSVINVESIKDKEYIGKNGTVFAVAPGETYMIKDNNSNKVMTAAVQTGALVTKFVLDGGVVYGQTSSNPHTGDSMLYLLIIIGISGLGAGFMFVKYRKHQKLLNEHLINNNRNSILSLFLVGAVTASILVVEDPVKVHAGGGGTYASGSNGTGKVIAGNLVTTDNVPSGTNIPGVLQIGFQPTSSANLTEDATIEDLAPTAKFLWADFRLYIAPTQRASDIWLNSGFLAKTGNDLYTIFGTSPLTSNVSAVYTAERAARTITVDTNSSNTFIKDISTAVKDKTLHSDTEPIGNALDDMIKGKYYNADQKVRDQFFNDYIDILSKTGVSQLNLENLKELYSQNKVSLFTQSLIGYRIKDSGATDFSKYCYLSVRDTLEVIGITESKEINPGESEWSIYSKLHPTDSNGPLDIKYGGLSGAGYRAVNKYMQQLYPLSNNITSGQPANPYGGFGFWHWSNDNSTTLAENPKLTADLAVTVVDERGDSTGDKFIVPVEGWKEKDNREFMDMINNVDSATVSGSMLLDYNNKVYSITPEDNTLIEFYDEYDNEPLNKFPLSENVSEKKINIKIPFYNDYTQWKFIIGGHTDPLPKSIHAYLGGPLDEENEEISWVDLDYYNWYMEYMGELPHKTKQENKYTNLQTSDGKPKSSNAKAIIHVKVQDVTAKAPDTEAYEIPQWRLSKYWENISEISKNKATFSMNLAADDSNSDMISTINPSGLVNFNLVKPTLPEWAKSKAKFLEGTGVASITHSNTSAIFNVGGDLLATRLSSENGIKLASWLSNIPYIDGVESATAGTVNNYTASYDKNYTFKYGIENSLSYNHKIAKYSHSSGSTTDPITGDTTYWDECNCYLVYETPKKEYTTAEYNKTVRYYRYVPELNNAIDFNNSSSTGNGSYEEVVQSNEILNVNPEVAMIADDIAGNPTGVFAAADRMRQIKPTAHNYIQFNNVSIKPTVIGSSVATDSRATLLANNLGVPGKQIIYRGAAVNISFELEGTVTAKSFALDIGGASKTSWNPSTSYKSQNVNDTFISRFATKSDDNTWTANIGKAGALVINNNKYSVNNSNETIIAKTTVKSHSLVVRAGKLITVDGTPVDNLTVDLKTAVEKMGLLDEKGILSVFVKQQGAALTEASSANLLNATTGTTDSEVGKGWYSEGTSMLVINEFTTMFELPKSMMFSDKIPMSVPGLEAPINKTAYFSKGFTGHTSLELKLPLTSYRYESIGKTTEYIVPNTSILDTTN
jgi:LPXTG-motif cell wall-anchored protein